jgi:CRP/FNR family transcriptional regulator, anaerobic regulatory protein
MVNALSEARPLTDGINTVLPCGPCEARTHGVCSAIPCRDLPRLAAAATIVEISRGQTFIYEDAPADYLYILILGSATLYKLLPDGRRQIVGFGYENSVLGLSVAESYAFSAEATEPTRLCRMPQQKLQALCHDFPAMKQRLLDVAVGKLVRAQEHILLLGRKTATERLASFLLLQTTRRQPRNVRWPRIHLPMSRNDMADYLGLAIETVSRSCTDLKNRGIITVPNLHEIVILDLSRLEALAHASISHPAARAADGTMIAPFQETSSRIDAKFGTPDRTHWTPMGEITRG